MPDDFGDVETIKRGTSAEAKGIPLRPGERRLLIVSAAGVSTIPLPADGRLVVGRAPSADIRLDEAGVSRAHAQLTVGRSVWIEDLGSVNGTRLRGADADAAAKTEVHPGDAIEIGPFTLVILGRGAAAPDGDDGVVVRAEATRELYRMIDRIAPGAISVLITGETGVGKEVAAEAIHRRSRRASGPFVRLNCAALAESLIESELFGHEKGAFTGALGEKPGLIETAHTGTLFLDEIGELPTSTQVKLLRVLEMRSVTRVGSVTPRDVDVRVVSATNRDLEEEIRTGRFRNDLYFRLNGITLHVPPLRDRREEILPLAERFIELVATRDPHLGRPAISDTARAALLAYPWPGNIRELRNVVDRAVLLSGGQTIEPEHLGQQAPVASAPTADGRLTDQMQAFERDRILEALKKCGGNQTKAAAMMGIARRTLIKRLDLYGIERPRKK